MSALLRVEGLSKRYRRLEALHEVTFELHPSELVAVIGPNGAGKTTLLSIIAGAIPPTAGTLDPPSLPVGWVPQQTALYSKLSVAENLRLFASLEHVPDVDAAVATMLSQTALRHRAHDPVSRLSGGNRQRVNVAIGLIAEPPLLALDEPSAALDPSQRARLWSFIAALVDAGTAVLFSTHNVSEAERFASRVLVLASGRLLFDGTPRELVRAAWSGGSDEGGGGDDDDDDDDGYTGGEGGDYTRGDGGEIVACRQATNSPTAEGVRHGDTPGGGGGEGEGEGDGGGEGDGDGGGHLEHALVRYLERYGPGESEDEGAAADGAAA